MLKPTAYKKRARTSQNAANAGRPRQIRAAFPFALVLAISPDLARFLTRQASAVFVEKNSPKDYLDRSNPMVEG
jgi:hypothetical protein